MKANQSASGKWRNPYRSLPAARWGVQAAFAIFLVWIGIDFAAFLAQSEAGGQLAVSRPPAVEGFLPISALMSLKRLALAGAWDPIHPAGLTIFIAVLLGALVARKSFCSWICPVGTLSRALEWLGSKTLWRRRRQPTLMPRWLDLPLSALKYLLLGFFALSIARMDLASLEGFLGSPYNLAADAKMYRFFADLSMTGAVVLAALALLSIAVKNFWCRYLCPYGALLGLFSWLSPLRPVRDQSTCIDCKLCTKACPVELQVHAKRAIVSPECTGCLACVAACPVKSCMTVGRKAEKGLSPWLVPVAGVGILLVLWGWARLSGHWQSAVPTQVLAEAYRHARELAHPGM